MDWFYQCSQENNGWFPGKDLSGRPDTVAAFPELILDGSQVAAYLLPDPYSKASDGEAHDEANWRANAAWNVQAQPGDRSVVTPGSAAGIPDVRRLRLLPGKEH